MTAILDSILRFVMISLLLLCVATVNLSLHSKVYAAQQSFDYKLPFRYGETWKVAENGVHFDYTFGVALDFNPIGRSTLEVIAPASGIITRGCTDRDQTYLMLNVGNGDFFSILHLQKDSVPIQKGSSQFVRRGDYLGKISTIPQYSQNGIGCTLISTGPHLHLGFKSTMCPLEFNGAILTCEENDNAGKQIQSTNIPENLYNSTNGLISYSANPALVMTVVNSNPNDQTAVRLQTNINNLHQKWRYDPQTREIQGLNDKCLDAGNTNDSSNRWLRIQTCSKKDNQQWYSDNKSRIHSLANFGMCIELKYDTEYVYKLVLNPCSDNENQEFNLSNETTKSNDKPKKAISFGEQINEQPSE